MRQKLFVIILLLITGLLYGCDAGFSKIPNEKIISNMSIQNLESGETTALDSNQFSVFMEAYNSSDPYRNDVGTTHPLRLSVEFDDGTMLIVWGGVGNFCTVSWEDSQFNIKSKKLEEWFEKFK